MRRLLLIILILLGAPLTQAAAQFVLRGQVFEKSSGLPAIGAVVMLPDRTGATTDEDGRFELKVTSVPVKVIVSLMSFQDQEITFNGKNAKAFERIVLEEDSFQIEQVVVTGVFERKKESFSGSAATYKADELKVVGSQNMLQSLATIDPSFKINDNVLSGSNPNAMPDFDIRGKSSVIGLKEQYGTDPNQPLFILDGFETDIATVMDLNLNRVASVTLLKDAASTAIYGSKAANGVVVIETKLPAKGRLQLNYKGDFSLSWADLTDYNLMNASEKLEFERLAKVYTDKSMSATEQLRLDNLYNTRLKGIAEGIDTYWLTEPLRTGFTDKHNIYLEGGEESIRYGVGLSIGNTRGVMKGSDRNTLGLNVDLIYRTGKFQFSNKLNVGSLRSSNPVESFSTFAAASPYYKKYSEDGTVERYLYYFQQGYTVDAVANPLYNWNLGSYDRSKSKSFSDDVIAEWFISKDLRARGKFGITWTGATSESLLSPSHTSFDNYELSEKGRYGYSQTDENAYEGDFTLVYGHLFTDKHSVNAVAGFNFSNDAYIVNGYNASGFTDDAFLAPSFAQGYPDGGKSQYSEAKSRSASFYVNGGYSFSDKYLLDLSWRLDGASMFALSRRWRNTWSVGLGWNIHKEEWFQDVFSDTFQMFKIRGSVGNPGNQNFSAYQSRSTYAFNGWMTNVFGAGAVLRQLGNSNLGWQETVIYNAGTDITLLGNRLSLVLDAYSKVTDPLLASITTPGSLGITTLYMNAGELHTKGAEFTFKVSPIYRPKERINWTISINGSHETAVFAGIGDKFSSLNEEGKESLTGTSRYYDGGSPTAIWAVRSAGIDPATGKELFIKKDGSLSFNYSTLDEVVLGDTEPLLEGVIGSTFYWKGFSASAYFRYSYGAQVFNSTLFRKVENISTSSILENQDRRALYDRWSATNTESYFKGISLVQTTNKSSRFVMDENYLKGESFSIGYECIEPWLQKLGLNSVTFQANMNDIFRLSTVTVERGTDYPFARSVSFSISAIF